MKTQMKKVFVYVRESNGQRSVEVSSNEFDASYCSDITNTVSAKVSEIEIAVPEVSEEDMAKILAGSLLETLIKQREEYQAEAMAKLKRMDDRIAEFKAIEHKE